MPALQAETITRCGTTRRSTCARALSSVAFVWTFGIPFHVIAADPTTAFSTSSIAIELPPGRNGDPPPIVTAMHLHPNGRWVVAAGDDHLIRIIDLPNRRVQRVMRGHVDWVDTVAFSPDGESLATAGSDNRVVMWDVETGKTRWVLRESDGPVSSIQFSHDGKTVAVVGFGRPLQLLNAENGRTIESFKCPCRDMRCVAFSPDDNRLAAAGRNGRVRVWDLADERELTTFVAHRQRVRDLTFGSTGDRLITAGEDRAVRVWDLPSATEEFFLAGVPGKVLSLTLLPNDRIATACSDNVIRIWSLQTRRLVGQLRGHRGSVASIDADSQRIVSAGFDATIRIWPIVAMDNAIVELQRRRSQRTQPVVEPVNDAETRPTSKPRAGESAKGQPQ